MFLYNILKSISLKPAAPRYSSSMSTNNLSQLEMMYPDFIKDIEGKQIIDYGSGEGYQSLDLAKRGANHVIGIEVFDPHIISANKRAQSQGLGNKVIFLKDTEDVKFRKADILISHNSMEHFEDPKGILEKFRNLIVPDGLIYITFGPLWYSMYGAHTNFFCLFPWIHLLFPESVVMKVRSAYTDDNAHHYEEIRGGLNKMSRKKFLHLLKESGFDIVYKKEMYVLGIHWLRFVPFFRELGIYNMSVILRIL